MSPNVDLEFSDDGFLVATDGESTRFKWTYSDFEDYLNESITPSMYEFMANYVYANITKDQRWELEADDYFTGDLEEEAVDAYFEVPALEREEMHKQTLANLKAELMKAEEKEAAASIETHPFDPTSPIYVELMTFLKKLAIQNKKKCASIKQQIHEEEQWRGGWENDGDSQMYDPVGEV
jgi:hypothetical protein